MKVSVILGLFLAQICVSYSKLVDNMNKENQIMSFAQVYIKLPWVYVLVYVLFSVFITSQTQLPFRRMASG